MTQLFTYALLFAAGMLSANLITFFRAAHLRKQAAIQREKIDAEAQESASTQALEEYKAFDAFRPHNIFENAPVVNETPLTEEEAMLHFSQRYPKHVTLHQEEQSNV